MFLASFTFENPELVPSRLLPLIIQCRWAEWTSSPIYYRLPNLKLSGRFFFEISAHRLNDAYRSFINGISDR